MYKIDFRGEWALKDIGKALSGVESFATALSRLTGEKPDDFFNRIFGTAILVISRSLSRDLNEFVSENGHITFRPGYVTPEITIHALGHLLNIVTNKVLAVRLYDDGVTDKNGLLVTGGHAYGTYFRFGYPPKKSPENGYQSDSFPFLQHPSSMKKWREAKEDLADGILNYVKGSFVDNSAGQALGEWYEENLKEVVAIDKVFAS